MSRRALAIAFGAGWLALLVLRITMNYAGGSSIQSVGQVARVVVPITSFWLPVIVVVLWLDRRPSLTGAPLAIAHVGLVTCIAFVEPYITREALGSVGVVRYYLGLFVGRLDTNILIYAVIVAGDRAAARLDVIRAREVAGALLEQALIDAQLHALALQLQPHFLFNALQFVAESAHEDLEAARRTLRLLRGLVHQAFTLESRLEVSLAEELDFLRAYGEIQRGRFGERFRLTIDADDATLGAGIPPLLLQPLVENASRHGFATRSEGGRVDVRARAEGTILSIVVSDDGNGLTYPVIEGQGLSVTRRRLERLHGQAARFTLARGSDGRTEATLRMPMRPASRPSPAPAVPHPMTEQTLQPPMTGSRSDLPFPLRLVALWSALLAIVVGATFAAVVARPVPAPGPIDVTNLLFDEIVGLPFWIAMTVGGVVAARRLRGPVSVPIHVALGIGFALAHAFLGDDVARLVFGESRPRAVYQQWITWDVLAYVAVVLVARSHELLEWARARMREEVTLSAQVVQATARLARLREMQAVLLAALDDVIASPTMESLDAAVIDFADFLRGEVMPDALGVAAGVTQ